MSIPNNNIFRNFKVNPCRNTECSLVIEKAFLSFAMYLRCSDYHNDIDRRRSCESTLNKVNYKPYYPYETNEINNQFCNNRFEYLFHPSIYKTSQCQNDGYCITQYCPYYHQRLGDKVERREFRFKWFKNQDQFQEAILELQGQESDAMDLTKSISQISHISRTTNPNSEVRLQKNQSSKNSKQLQKYKSQIIKADPKTLKEISDMDKSISGQQPFTIVQPLTDSKYYVNNQQISYFEDATHEFKMLKQIRMDMVSKYICAFLNSRGGTLYIGITDAGRVRGIRVQRKDIDLFQLELDQILRKFDPLVLQEQIVIKFIPVYLDNTRRVVQTVYIVYYLLKKTQCQYVIEIQVKTLNQFELYFTHKREAFMKREASVNLLTPKEIKAYVKARTLNQMEKDSERKVSQDQQFTYQQSKPMFREQRSYQSTSSRRNNNSPFQNRGYRQATK